MCPCFKLTPTFVAADGYDDEMSPDVVNDFTKLNINKDSNPNDKMYNFKRDFVSILDSIDLKGTYETVRRPRKNINDLFNKPIY